MIFTKKSDDEENFLFFIMNLIKGSMGVDTVFKFLIDEAYKLFEMKNLCNS